MEYILFLILAVLAAGLHFLRPFRNSGKPASYDATAIAVATAIALIILCVILLKPSFEAEKNFVTCGSATKEGQCYRLPMAVCKSLWEKFNDSCGWEVKEQVSDRPTALIGPAVKKCTKLKFDKAVYYTRRDGNSECQEYFNTLVTPPGE